MKLNYEDLGVFLPEMKEEEKQDLVKRLGKLSDVEYKQVQELYEEVGAFSLKGRVKLDPYTFLLKQNIFRKPSRASAPLAVDLYVTRRCNLNCVYCFANAKHVANQNSNALFPEMSLDKINWIIDQIVQLDIKKILITGGEPTLRPE